jgi:hypothetical protein
LHDGYSETLKNSKPGYPSFVSIQSESPMIIVPILAVATIGFITKKALDEIKKSSAGSQPQTSQSAPVHGLPSSGAGAPIGITPPGIPQPADRIIALPPQETVSQAVHDASASLIQAYSVSGPPPTGSDEVRAFQVAYNATNPDVPLATDGNYGAKTQAVLQSVVTPAIAPQQIPNATPIATPITSTTSALAPAAKAMLIRPKFIAIAAPKANPAIVPNLSVAQDVTKAANALYDFLVKGGSSRKGSFKEVTTFQAAWNAHHRNQPLVADGMYGPNAKNALQAVFNWMNDKRKAPNSPYAAGGVAFLPVKIPTFIP